VIYLYHGSFKKPQNPTENPEEQSPGFLLCVKHCLYIVAHERAQAAAEFIDVANYKLEKITTTHAEAAVLKNKFVTFVTRIYGIIYREKDGRRE